MAANVKNFWASYRSAVIASGVPEKNAEWFVRWAQKFSDSIKGKSLHERSAADIRQFCGTGQVDLGGQFHPGQVRLIGDGRQVQVKGGRIRYEFLQGQ